MRSPVVKRPTCPRRGWFQFFSAVVQAERSPPLATCAVFLCVDWCTNVATPHTSGGSLAAVTPSAETTPSGCCDRDTYLSPPTILCQEAAARQAFAREAQARGRGRPRQPATPVAVGLRAGADVPSQGRAQGGRPMCA
jgi:hypothetical protein